MFEYAIEILQFQIQALRYGVKNDPNPFPEAIYISQNIKELQKAISILEREVKDMENKRNKRHEMTRHSFHRAA